MFYKIAKTLGVIASVTGIIMMVGACFRMLESLERKRKIREAREHARREVA